MDKWSWSESRGVDDPDYPRLVKLDGGKTPSIVLPRAILGKRADEVVQKIVEILNRREDEEDRTRTSLVPKDV